MANIKDDKVYVVIYSFRNLECSQDDDITTKVFDDEVKAEAYLKKSYEETLSENSDEELSNGIIDSDNYGNNAEILVGDVADGSVTYIHSWRVVMNTINYED